MGAVKFKTGIDVQSQRILNVADPSTPTDGVNKQYADALVRGLDWKAEVVAAPTGNISLSSPGGTVDGVVLSAGMQNVVGIGSVTRLLLFNQSSAAENGIYDWNGSGVPLTRSIDADSGTELSGATTTIQQGTTYADRVYRCITDNPITVNTTPLAWTQVGGAAAPYIGGAGMSLSGQTFNVGQGNGIVVDTDDVRVDPSVVVRKYAANCAATTNPQTFTHGLGTDDVSVDVYESNELVYCGVTKGAGTVIIDFGSAPTASQYRVIVQA